MKNLVMFLAFCFLWTVPVQAESAAEIKNTILNEMREEGLITQLAFNKQKAEAAYVELNNKRQLNRIEYSKKGGGTAGITGDVSLGLLDVEGVTIHLFNSDTSQYVDGQITDQFGSYTFSNLDAGNYHVVANDKSDNYVDVMWSSLGMVQCQYCLPDANSIILLADAATQTGVDFELTVGAVVNGNVTDGSSAVISEFVTIRGVAPLDFHLNQETDASGNFSFQGLPAGDFYVTKTSPSDVYIDAMWSSLGTVQCYDCQVDTDSTLVLSEAEIRNGIDLTLTIGASVTGVLVDGLTMAQVDTLSVRIYDVADIYSNWYFVAQLDGSGNYAVSGIPAGNYKVYLDPKIELSNEYIPEIYNNIQCNACGILLYDGAGDALALVNGVNTPNIDFHLSKGASISGIFLNNDHPTETVEEFGLVYLFNDANRVLALQYLYGTNSNPSFDGTYKIGGLLPGMYFVQGGDLGREFFQRELFENVACPWSGCDRGAGGTPVVLGATEQRLGVNFLLNYGGKISGIITDSMTGLPIESSNLTQYVQFYNSDGVVAGGAGINSDGSYTSQRALPPGTYSVRTGSMFNGEFNSPYVMQKYMPGGNIDCPGLTCDLTAGNVNVSAYVRQNPRDPVAEAAAATVTGVDFALSQAFSFTGVITEFGSSVAIPDVHVLVYDDLGRFANWATTDAAGGFTVHGLPAGTYYALTNNGSNLPFMGLNQTVSGGWIDILFDGTACPGSTCDVTTGDPIILGAGGNPQGNGEPSYSFGLNAGGTISGQVKSFGSQLPASGVNVNVYNSSGDFFGSYQTDNSGHYLTVGFPIGTYYLTTTNNGALIDAKYGGGYCSDENCNPLDAEPLVISGNETLVDKDFILKPDFIFKSGMN